MTSAIPKDLAAATISSSIAGDARPKTATLSNVLCSNFRPSS